ncbi:MAG TPA: hypothetical protein PKD20_00795 [Candidatus Saccharibacteria bacterium]|jgi:hypothetical protein|nr:hypothetical protein [Candidatus Saccharibacteria bacterium]HMT55394.1 hypothetical protein [Candidatus Saccharibacteria bacterium]
MEAILQKLDRLNIFTKILICIVIAFIPVINVIAFMVFSLKLIKKHKNSLYKYRYYFIPIVLSALQGFAFLFFAGLASTSSRTEENILFAIAIICFANIFIIIKTRARMSVLSLTTASLTPTILLIVSALFIDS